MMIISLNALTGIYWFWLNNKVVKVVDANKVLMPSRAFIDSDILLFDWDESGGGSLNALTGIYWFWL